MSGAPTEFGDLLKALRAERGWTQEDLYEKSGVSLGAIKHIETYRTRIPSPETVRALLLAFKLKGSEKEAFQSSASAVRHPSSMPGDPDRIRAIEERVWRIEALLEDVVARLDAQGSE